MLGFDSASGWVHRFLLLFFQLWKKKTHKKFTILTILMYSSVVLSTFALLCEELQNFFFWQNRNPIPIKQQLFIPSSSHLATTTLLCLHEFDCFRLFLGMESQQYLSFCDWLLSLSTRSSRAAQARAGIRLSRLDVANSLAPHGHWYTHSGLSIHLLGALELRPSSNSRDEMLP